MLHKFASYKMLTTTCSGGATWWGTGKIERGCTTTNLPLSNDIKIVSIRQRYLDEVVSTNYVVQQRDGQTDKQTDKKTQRFCLPWRRAKSELHQTWHGDRGPRARSCTSKTFCDPTYSFAARGAENLVNPDPLKFKPP